MKLLLTAALAAALLVPAAASAGTVTSSGGELRYAASAGEANALRFSADGPDVVVEDSAGVQAGAGCSVAGQAARCARQGITRVTVELDDRDDSIAVDLGADTLPVAVTGGRGEDALRGGAGDDLITSLDITTCPEDQLECNFFNDTVECGPGFDTVDADRGDTVAADCELVARLHQINGTPSADRIEGFRQGLTINGFDGPDFLSGLGNDSLNGGAGDDTLRAGPAPARGGRNTLAGGSGDDDIRGARGFDYVSGGTGADRIRTGAGNDYVQGLAGRDAISAGAGNDAVVSRERGAERDRVSCGSGRDIAVIDRNDVVSRDCERRTTRAVALLARTTETFQVQP